MRIFQRPQTSIPHLDFSSKVHSAETIANALGAAAPKLQVAKPEFLDEKNCRKQYLIKALLEEMFELGIDNLKDYLAFIDNEEKEPKQKRAIFACRDNVLIDIAIKESLAGLLPRRAFFFIRHHNNSY